MDHQNFKLDEIKEIIGQARRQVIDATECAFGSYPQWYIVRSRILKAFGTEGAEGLIQKAISKADASRSLEVSNGHK